jgi:hypothetical protein
MTSIGPLPMFLRQMRATVVVLSRGMKKCLEVPRETLEFLEQMLPIAETDQARSPSAE